jgi:hypothetical protein
MAVPVLTPASTLSAIVLPSSGRVGDVANTLPLGIYSTNAQFLSGAADQVAFAARAIRSCPWHRRSSRTRIGFLVKRTNTKQIFGKQPIPAHR